MTGILLLSCDCGACIDLDGPGGSFLVSGDGSDEDAGES